MSGVNHLALVAAILEELDRQFPGRAAGQRELDAVTDAAELVKRAFAGQFFNAPFYGQQPARTGIRVTMSSSGRKYAYISACIRRTYSHVQVEVDREKKQILVRAGNELGLRITKNGARDTSTGGSVSINAHICKEVLPGDMLTRFIDMRPSEDGWWIGSYAE